MSFFAAIKSWPAVSAGMFLFLVVFSSPSIAKTVLIDDFDTGQPKNLLGGAFNVWGKDPKDTSQWCRMSFDPNVKAGEKGRALKLEYSVESEREAYDGLWMKLKDLDLRPMRYLVFSIKGDAEKGCTTCVTIELKAKNKTGRVNVVGITDRWRKVIIPLEKFSGIRDWSKVDELTVVFIDELASKKKGCLYLDNLYVTDTEPMGQAESHKSRCLITDFNDGIKVNTRGGRFDVWSRAVAGMADPKQSCDISFDTAVREGVRGCSLKITYALSSAKSSGDGVWMQLNDFDASHYRYLVFSVKGDKHQGFTRRMKVELKGAAGTGAYTVEGIKSDWKRVVVPLRMFQGINDFKNMREFVIIFDAETVTRPAGVIYIDNVMFLKSLKYTDKRRGP